MHRRIRLISGGLVAACALAGTQIALAQAPDPNSSPNPNDVSMGGVAPDHTAIVTLQGENASISSAALTDRYYVNGIRLGFVSGTGSAPQVVNDFATNLFGPGQTRFDLGLSQQLYTPRDDRAVIPPPGDRPYAATLLGHIGLQQDSDETRSTLGLDFGVLGPLAQGQEVQNGFHDIIGQAHANGWSTQLRNEPLFEILASRVYREPLGTVGPFETDTLLDGSVGVGNLKDYAEFGGQLRIGSGLNSDFGVARLRPGQSGGDTFKGTQPFAYYAFVGVSGQGILHNELLDGESFGNSAHVHSYPYLGEIEGGIGVIFHGARLTYTQVAQTQEFHHQKGGLHQFGSLALSVRF